MAPTEALVRTVQDLVADNWLAIACALAAIALLQLWLFSSKIPKPFLSPGEFKPLALTEKKFITHNTVWLRLDLPSKTQRLGLPIGQHISFLAKDSDGKDVYRSYTPVSDDDQLGCVDFVIKIYPQGKMSQVINKMSVGDTMHMKGPKGRLQYKSNMKKHIGMLAGGTGVTPMYQVLNAILKNPADKTQVSLIFGNISEEDILLHKELEALAAAHADRFKVHYVLDKPPVGWTGSAGYITTALISQHLPAPGPDTLILRCGPTPMVEAMKKTLDAMGYAEDQQFQF